MSSQLNLDQREVKVYFRLYNILLYSYFLYLEFILTKILF